MKMSTSTSFSKNAIILVLFFFLAGCAVMQGKSSPSDYTSDTGITTQIKAKLVQSDMVSAPNVHVETQNGIVQMSGFVSSNAQVNEAERIARSVNGVKGVVNDLVVQNTKRNRK